MFLRFWPFLYKLVKDRMFIIYLFYFCFMHIFSSFFVNVFTNTTSRCISKFSFFPIFPLHLKREMWATHFCRSFSQPTAKWLVSIVLCFENQFCLQDIYEVTFNIKIILYNLYLLLNWSINLLFFLKDYFSFIFECNSKNMLLLLYDQTSLAELERF